MQDGNWEILWKDLLAQLPELREEHRRRDLVGCLDNVDPSELLDEYDLRNYLLALRPEKDGKAVRAALNWMEQQDTARHSHKIKGAVETVRAETLARTAKPKRPWMHDEPPYLGLSTFTERDAPIFFGRETELRQLCEMLAANRTGLQFTVVVGASGSGKSSLVRAGLVAGLKEGTIPQLPGSKTWLINVMKPFELGTPLHSLAAKLAASLDATPGYRDKVDLAREAHNIPLSELTGRLLASAPKEARWLLILDQMEELFTAEEKDKDKSAAFLTALINAARPGRGGVPSRFHVVATLRRDLEHYSDNYPLLAHKMNEGRGRFVLKAPDIFALERMVSGPINEVVLPKTWTIDPELPSVVAQEAAGQSGGLALMAFALRELCDRCGEAGRMSLKTWQNPQFGGLAGCVASKAEKVLHSLDPACQARLGRVFSALVHLSQEEDIPTRKRAPRSTWQGDEPALRFVDAFLDKRVRLLVSDKGKGGDPLIEVAHEVLFTHWPVLSNWIAGRREAFHLLRRLQTEAEAWELKRQKATHAKKYRRPWDPKEIDEFRARLENADMLHVAMADKSLREMLTPGEKWIRDELNDDSTKPMRRWELGLQLEEVGDTRDGVGLKDGMPDILWMDIPAGKVELMDGEKSLGEFPVEPFSISAFPVTFAQFRAFVQEEDGYRQKKKDGWWSGLRRQAPDAAWEDAPGNHPVTNVSWHDATAFCRWLSERRGEKVRLPEEWEWQWAAQSASASFAFPWGPEWEDGRANTWESGVLRTTAVGIFPLGDSVQSVSDLAGNVWEWCRNEHANPARTTGGGGEARVLRGGSWNDLRYNARAVYRYDNDPDYRDDGVGFRVVCSSPIRTEP
jgi:energy-coupling factor transporter ATP-binding protein EcfA2